MEALQCIKTRRSVRKYSDQPVTREVLDAVFDAVTYAPSWKNTQSVRYTVVDSAELKAKIAEEAVLGSVIMGVFDEDILAKLIGLPEGQTVTGMIAIGYPAGENKMPPRKPASDIVTYL